MSFPIPVRPSSHAIYKEIYTMNNVKKMAVTLAMFGMGVFGLANNINTPVNNVNQVQAAAKPKKLKGVHYYKNVHVVTLFGDGLYGSINDIKKGKVQDDQTTGYSGGNALGGPSSIDGYTYVSGKKYLHDMDGNVFFPASNLKKRPKYYTVKSKIQVYAGLYNQNTLKGMEVDSNGFTYEDGCYVIKPNQGKKSIIAVMPNKIYHVDGIKYYAATSAIAGNKSTSGYIKVSDVKKLAKGASPAGTGFSKANLKADEHTLLNYNRKHGGAWNTWANRHAVIGGISAK